MAELQNTPSTFDELEEGEIDFLIKLEETCLERLKKLLSMQDSELKMFKYFKEAYEMELEVNCKWKIPNPVYEIMKKDFERHMKIQYRNFIAMQNEARNKEEILKENWVEMAKIGRFETTFFETPIPDSKFKMEKFDYESNLKNLLAKKRPAQNVFNPTNPNFRSQSNLNPNLESEEFLGNKNEIASDETTLDATNANPKQSSSPSHNPNFNPNSPVSVMPNSNSQIHEALEKDEMPTCVDTTLNVSNPYSPPITQQNPNMEIEVMVVHENAQNPNLESELMVVLQNAQNPNPSFVPALEHDTSVNSSNEEMTQINSNSTPNVSNICQINQVRQFSAGDIDLANEQFCNFMAPELLHENPSQNELVQKVNEELETKCSKRRYNMKRRAKNDKLTQESHDIYHNTPHLVPCLHGSGSSSKSAAPTATQRPATSNLTSSSNPAVQTPVSRPVQIRDLNSEMIISELQNKNSVKSVSGREMVRASPPHLKRFRPNVVTNINGNI